MKSYVSSFFLSFLVWHLLPIHCIVIPDRTQWDTHSVGLLWTKDRSVPETSTATHNNHKRQTSMLPTGFEQATPAKGRPQTCAATGVSRNQTAGRNLITATLKVLIRFGETLQGKQQGKFARRWRSTDASYRLRTDGRRSLRGKNWGWRNSWASSMW